MIWRKEKVLLDNIMEQFLICYFLEPYQITLYLLALASVICTASNMNIANYCRVRLTYAKKGQRQRIVICTIIRLCTCPSDRDSHGTQEETKVLYK